MVTLVPIEHHLNGAACLSIIADLVHPFMTTPQCIHLLVAPFSRITCYVTVF